VASARAPSSRSPANALYEYTVRLSLAPPQLPNGLFHVESPSNRGSRRRKPRLRAKQVVDARKGIGSIEGAAIHATANSIATTGVKAHRLVVPLEEIERDQPVVPGTASNGTADDTSIHVIRREREQCRAKVTFEIVRGRERAFGSSSNRQRAALPGERDATTNGVFRPRVPREGAKGRSGSVVAKPKRQVDSGEPSLDVVMVQQPGGATSRRLQYGLPHGPLNRRPNVGNVVRLHAAGHVTQRRRPIMESIQAVARGICELSQRRGVERDRGDGRVDLIIADRRHDTEDDLTVVEQGVRRLHFGADRHWKPESPPRARRFQ
jgi:hypothetical protein